MVIIRDGPGPEDGRRRGPDGGIVGGEREPKRSRHPSNQRGGRVSSHDAGTIAPWRLSSSTNAETSPSASSPLRAGKRSRRLAVRSSRLAAVASRCHNWLPVGFSTSALREVR